MRELRNSDTTRSLAICEKALGPEHPDTAASLNNLARLLHDQGDLAGARPLFKRALTIREKALGPEHPDTATSLNNLALLLKDQGDLAGARPLFERALAISEKALGPEHPDTNAARGNLARLQTRGRRVRRSACTLRSRARGSRKSPRRRSSLDEDSADIVAAALDALGRADEAAALRAGRGLGGGSAAWGGALRAERAGGKRDIMRKAPSAAISTISRRA